MWEPVLQAKPFCKGGFCFERTKILEKENKMNPLFFVKFPDEAIYCTGPQTNEQGETRPGGIVGYETTLQAEKMASAIEGGRVIQRNMNQARKRCYELGISLYIKWADGQVTCYPPAIAKDDLLIRIEGSERERLLVAAQA